MMKAEKLSFAGYSLAVTKSDNDHEASQPFLQTPVMLTRGLLFTEETKAGTRGGLRMRWFTHQGMAGGVSAASQVDSQDRQLFVLAVMPRQCLAGQSGEKGMAQSVIGSRPSDII